MASRAKDRKSAQEIKEQERKAREERRLKMLALQDSNAMAVIENEASKAIEKEQEVPKASPDTKPSSAPSETVPVASEKVSVPIEKMTIETEKTPTPVKVEESISHTEVIMPTSEPFAAMNEAVSPKEVSAEPVTEEKPKTTKKKTGYVKSAKRRVEKTVSDIKTVKKEVVPEEARNYTYTQSFSVDENTMNQLEAVVELLQKSGLTIDDRLITVSSFARRAVQRELQNTYAANGPEFEKLVKDMIRKKDEPLGFKLG